MRHLITALFLTASALFAAPPAELEGTQSDPLQLAQLRASEAGTSTVLRFEMRSAAAKQVRGYTVIAEQFDASGKSLCSNSRTLVVGVGKARKPFTPGEAWSEDLSVGMHKTAAVLKVLVDYVSFADGSGWGADKERSSRYIDGVHKGATLAAGTK